MGVPFSGSSFLQDGMPPVERCFVFAVDSVPEYMIERRPELFKHALRMNSVRARSESPSVTPVCFASMFTGLSPAEHGITKYEKPVLKCKTLFDSLVEAGKRVAIVAVKEQSIDRIFRGRPIDYFSERYDAEVVGRALKLLAANEHDFILAYNQEYDDADHATTPTSVRSIAALRHYDANTKKLHHAFSKYWSKHSRLFMWVTDHGCHVDRKSGKGSHGKKIPEDVNVRLFYDLVR